MHSVDEQLPSVHVEEFVPVVVSPVFDATVPVAEAEYEEEESKEVKDENKLVNAEPADEDADFE